MNKLYEVEFGRPEGVTGRWITIGGREFKLLVLAETYAKAIGKALKYVKEKAESGEFKVDEDGSLVNHDYATSIKKITLVADEIIQ